MITKDEVVSFSTHTYKGDCNMSFLTNIEDTIESLEDMQLLTEQIDHTARSLPHANFLEGRVKGIVNNDFASMVQSDLAEASRSLGGLSSHLRDATVSLRIIALRLKSFSKESENS